MAVFVGSVPVQPEREREEEGKRARKEEIKRGMEKI